MRIIAGRFRGLPLAAPAGYRTHPMSDKVRGALFNTLGDIAGLTVLDVFAGSGAVGMEALSRGAASVLAIEKDKTAYEAIQKNIQSLKAGPYAKALHMNASTWSDKNSDVLFDLVLADPPYDQLQLKVLQKLFRHVRPSGLLVLSWPGQLEAPEFLGAELTRQKTYGDAQLVFYRRSSVK